MDLKACTNCGESVDATKAFCPGCGNPFVLEQQRDQDSEFDASGSTVQFSQSAFNMVLSDMGLNLAESPYQPTKAKVKVVAEPAVKPIVDPAPDSPPKSNAVKWILITAAIAVAFLAFLVVAAAVGFYFYTKST